MGLTTSNSSKTYVTIAKCKFCVRVDADTPGAVARELEGGSNKGSIIHELQYTGLEGMVTNFAIKEGMYGVSIELTIDNKECLQLSLASGIGNSFIKRLPNIDFSQPISFGVFPDKTTKKAVLTIRQNDKQVNFAFTKDRPNGMPSAKQITRMGKTSWDFTEQEEFLYNVLTDCVDKFVPSANGSDSGSGSDSSSEVDVEAFNTAANDYENETQEVPF